jgi:hypothetical protein
MLNIDELSNEFDRMLFSLTKEDLLEWVLSYENRILLERLQRGEKVMIDYLVPQIINIENIDISTTFTNSSLIGNYNYAMAA